VNNGTYLVAGATTEEDYQRLRRLLIGTFGELDERLAGRRFLFGGGITEADVRLWPTLARFDLSYNPLGKISERRLTGYPNLWGYARDLYQHPAFRETTDFGAFGRFAEGPKPSFVNEAPWRIAVEPVPADWDTPHQREALASA
jgi:glutathionyl-hydroquinone reductase